MQIRKFRTIIIKLVCGNIFTKKDNLEIFNYTLFDNTLDFKQYDENGKLTGQMMNPVSGKK